MRDEDDDYEYSLENKKAIRRFHEIERRFAHDVGFISVFRRYGGFKFKKTVKSLLAMKEGITEGIQNQYDNAEDDMDLEIWAPKGQDLLDLAERLSSNLIDYRSPKEYVKKKVK